MTDHSPSLDAGDHLYLIDGSGYIFRAYHALPPLSRSDGTPTGAVHGFCQMLWKLLEDMKQGDRPSHFAVIFDAKGKTFRNDIYPEYKAHRPEPPEDLVPQFALIREAVRAFDLPCIELDGYEADDLIAAYARRAEEQGAKVTIVSSDKDLMQLVSEHVCMFDTMKNRRILRPEVEAYFGVGPERVVDVQALAGDASDNVPGVPGIGIKTAALLINEYGDLDTLLERAGEIKQPKRRQNLIEFADQARLSRDLVRLDVNAPMPESLDAFRVHEPDPDPLLSFLARMEFTRLASRISEALDAQIPQAEDDPDEPRNSPARLAAARALGARKSKINRDEYVILRKSDELQIWVREAREQGHVAVDTETTSLDAMQAGLVGISLALAPGKACYIPLGHKPEGLDLGGDDLDQMPLDEALEQLKPMLEDPGILKIGQNLKYDGLLLARYGIKIAPLDDTMLLSYALDSGRGGHGMDELSKRHLDHEPIPFKQVAGSGKSRITFDRVPIAQAAEYAAEDADVTFRLWQVLKPRLAAESLTSVYETLERPLVPVLARMERAGIKVDREELSRLSAEFAGKMSALEAEIYQIAGEHFNIASPAQLGQILFGKMGLEGGRKTRTGAWSTNAAILEDLAGEGNELAARVLDWRTLAKLKSTYTDALPGFINPETGRVHTSYSMAATTTGRLASSEPNLQNIPVRTADGRRIRRAFVAPGGFRLISADYSQIELRVLAHIADIGALKQAFAEGLDIHAMTASEMFNVPIEAMPPDVRRRAKAINFGIIYGISAFGLARQLGISRGEAADYIKMYFERFPGIRDFMEAAKDEARARGYVTTAFGRRCHYPQINSKNQQQRAFMERAAINAPIQGTAADILRRAMIRMEEALEQANLGARMLLQVHDELIFEAPEAEVEATIKTAVNIMERACEPVLALSVPLKVDARAARNWDEAH
jgi:DNA polymerase-1